MTLLAGSIFYPSTVTDSYNQLYTWDVNSRVLLMTDDVIRGVVHRKVSVSWSPLVCGPPEPRLPATPLRCARLAGAQAAASLQVTLDGFCPFCQDSQNSQRLMTNYTKSHLQHILNVIAV